MPRVRDVVIGASTKKPPEKSGGFCRARQIAYGQG
jgi:hypothetical protein